MVVKMAGSCVASVAYQKWSLVPACEDAMHFARRVFPVTSVVVSPTLPLAGALETGLLCEVHAVLPELL